MSHTWMMTIERHPERESIEEVKILQWIIKNDIHDWIVAKETGTFGYHHWQIRMRTQYNFKQMKAFFPKAHIEEASENDNYERKSGNYIASTDTVETLRARYGSLRDNQSTIMENIKTQNDRQIDVVWDEKGGSGKTFLARALYQRSEGFFVPPTLSDGKQIIQFVASGYRGEPIIFIDIARSTRWNNGLYVALETLKDGLIYDARYHTTTRDIHGVKVLVTCNTKPNLSKLSKDRWRLYDRDGRALST